MSSSARAACAPLVLAMTAWFSASAVVPQLRAEWNMRPATARPTRRWAFAFLAPGPARKKDQPLEAGSADGRAACGRAS